MSAPPNDALSAFADRIIEQLAKHGFPERRVAFPLEQLYESADAKGLSFNNVLEVLAARGVEHEKTPEKVIFAPAAVAPSIPGAEAFAGFDPAMLAGLSQEELLGMAQAAMQQMSPDQLAAMRAMFEGMTPEAQAALIEQARKLGLG